MVHLSLAASGPATANPQGAQNLAITIPGVGAFLSGSPTVAHTWCPTGTVGNAASLLLLPQGPSPDNSVNAATEVLAATTDGNHILGATLSGTNINLSDIGLTIPSLNCLPPDHATNPLALGDAFSPLALTTALQQPPTITANASAINQVVVSPNSSLAFITYNPATNANTTSLPYYVPGTYVPGTGFTSSGTVGSVTLGGSSASAITAPIAGVFSPDSSYFFVSTAGNNLIHYISVPTMTDVQQISPNLPSCTPVSSGGNDQGCTYTGTPGAVVPATGIEVKPRPTT